MISTIAAVSPEFESAAARVVWILDSASRHLQGKWDATEDLLDQTDLLYLSSMAQLVACRGWHFISDDTAVDVAVDVAVNSVEELADKLAVAHLLLIDHVTGLDTFEVLQFVDEVGALCREMRRYVERH